MLNVTPDRPTCPAFDGIYFPEDHSVISIEGSPGAGYTSGERKPIDEVVPVDCLDWSPDLEALDTCRFETTEILVVGGGGTYEGEGFLAAFAKPSLEPLWLLYSQSAESFRRVAAINQELVAISADPPYLYEWRLSLKDPTSLQVGRLSSPPVLVI
ncbi:MAG: hypothetical protein ABIT01_15090 [Thermoanaerobaculia bacterium]